MLPHLTRLELLRLLTKHGLNQNKLILNALSQAIKSHRYQKRDDGSPYLEQHIYPVAATVIFYLEQTTQKVTPEIIASSILHDVLEDDKNIDENEFINTFGNEVFNIVKALTRPDRREFSGNKKEQMKAADNKYLNSINLIWEAKIVKLADRLNNILCLHSSPVPGKRARYIQTTLEHYIPLAKEIPWFYEKLVAAVNVI